MKYNIIVSDPPWSFDDKLVMSDVKRGAASQYDILNLQAIKDLQVEKICAKDALLALWTPSSMLSDGLDVMKEWGFNHKQTFIWVKTKVNPFEVLKKNLKKVIRECYPKLNELRPIKGTSNDLATLYKGNKISHQSVDNLLALGGFNSSLLMDDMLAFGMGRLFRNTHEIALIGTRGKIYNKLENKSQRTVHFNMALKHSTKPEGLQDRLDLMFPDKSIEKMEMFARRPRKGWITVGNELPGKYYGEDIRDSLDRLSKRKLNENSTAKFHL